jgi:hypothetical protein
LDLAAKSECRFAAYLISAEALEGRVTPTETSIWPQNIAVVGSGISGLSAAWLLSQRHRVTLLEADTRIGGHSHTVDAGNVPVDTGFIVYNEKTYPNLTALFAHLQVPTRATEMTFAVSLDRGRLEYSGTGFGGIFAQKRNLASPRFWSMLRDLVRFYRAAPGELPRLGSESLGTYLDRGHYGAAFRDDHLYPMAAAIWSTPVGDIPIIRPRPSSASAKITACSIWASGRCGAPSKGAVASMSIACTRPLCLASVPADPVRASGAMTTGSRS